MFVFLRSWLTLWLVASWRSNRVNYCWHWKLQSYLLAVDLFFSVRTLMNETHRIATKEMLKNGHQKSRCVLIYLLLQCYSSVRKSLFSSIPPFVSSLHQGDSVSFNGPSALFHFSLPWIRFQALTRALQLHSSVLPSFHSWTGHCPSSSMLVAQRVQKTANLSAPIFTPSPFPPNCPPGMNEVFFPPDFDSLFQSAHLHF